LYGYVIGDPINLLDPSGLYGIDDLDYDIRHVGDTWEAMKGAASETGATLADFATFWNTNCSCGGASTMDNFVATNGSVPGLLAPTGAGALANALILRSHNIPSLLEWLRRGGSVMGFNRMFGKAIRATGAVSAAWLAGTATGSFIRAKYGPCE
jgi:hypothetical protein